MSFCRISGKSKKLPKPNFFPIIPSISLAHARKLCRITGRRMDKHRYMTLLEVGKRPACVRNKGAGKGQNKGVKAESEHHNCQNDFKYVTPVLKRELIEEDDLKAFDDLAKQLETLRAELDQQSAGKTFVYLLPSMLCGLMLQAELEESIKRGVLESVSVSKSYDKAIFKMKGKPTLFVPLNEVNVNQVMGGKFFDGKGQSKETLNRQKQLIENRKRRTLFASRKIFEDLEKQAAEDLLKDLERPVGKTKVLGIRRTRRAQMYRERLSRFKETYLAMNNMSSYGEWKPALRTKAHQMNWDRIKRIIPTEIDVTMPSKLELFPLSSEEFERKKRIKNVYIPDQPGLELVPYFEDTKFSECQVSKDLIQFIEVSKEADSLSSNSMNSMFSDEEALKVLPTLNEFQGVGAKFDSAGSILQMGCMYDQGDGIKYASSPEQTPSGSNVVVGAVIETSHGPKFFPGELIKQKDGRQKFLPGQKMSSVDGEFIPGCSLRDSAGQFQFIPGLMSKTQFFAGQFVLSEGKTSFVKGQVVHTMNGTKFVEGDTTLTHDGIKMVAGVTIRTEEGPTFVPGTMVDNGEDEAKFVPGQLFGGTTPEDLTFIGGQMGNDGAHSVFVPGQTINNSFIPGQMVDYGESHVKFLSGDLIFKDGQKAKFVPGIYETSPSGNESFVPGVALDTTDGQVFMEGRLHRVNNEAFFVPGHFEDGHFERARDPRDINLRQSPEPVPCLDGNSLSLVFQKARPKNGVMVKTKNGSRFYADGERPNEFEGAEEVTPGRMEVTDLGPTFVPGQTMVLNGIKSFIPGIFQRNPDGTKTFVPGKMTHTKNGPKFVCGQVIQTEDGEKFLPGLVLSKPDGKTFVPAMEIQTKSGPVLIPGQVIRTDNGLKFVPGDIVSTENGAQFVPGVVMDSPEGAKLLKGEVIDTPDGPRLLPPDINGDGDLEYCVQGFDINIEEARLLLGKSASSSDISDILGGVGGVVVSPEALRALADGFSPAKCSLIKTVGEGANAEEVLKEDLLESYDSKVTREIVFEEMMVSLKKLAGSCLDCEVNLANMGNGKFLDKVKNILISDMKLNPALDKLKIYFESNDCKSMEEDVVFLLSSILTCSIPSALKDCTLHHNNIDREEFKKALQASTEDSLQQLLQENGILSKDLQSNLKELTYLIEDQDKYVKPEDKKSAKKAKQTSKKEPMSLKDRKSLSKVFYQVLKELHEDTKDMIKVNLKAFEEKYIKKLTKETIASDKMELPAALNEMESVLSSVSAKDEEQLLILIVKLITKSIPTALDVLGTNKPISENECHFKEILLNCVDIMVKELLTNKLGATPDRTENLKELLEVPSSEIDKKIINISQERIQIQATRAKAVREVTSTKAKENIVDSIASAITELAKASGKSQKEIEKYLNKFVKPKLKKLLKEDGLDLKCALDNLQKELIEQANQKNGGDKDLLSLSSLVVSSVPKVIEEMSSSKDLSQVESKGEMMEEIVNQVEKFIAHKAAKGQAESNGLSIKDITSEMTLKDINELLHDFEDQVLLEKVERSKTKAVPTSAIKASIKDVILEVVKKNFGNNKEAMNFANKSVIPLLEAKLGRKSDMTSDLQEIQEELHALVKKSSTDPNVQMIGFISEVAITAIPKALKAMKSKNQSSSENLSDCIQEAMSESLSKLTSSNSDDLNKQIHLLSEGVARGDVDLQDENLVSDLITPKSIFDKYDNMENKKIVSTSFISVFSHLCSQVEQLVPDVESFIKDDINKNIGSSILSRSFKLLPGLEELSQMYTKERTFQSPNQKMMTLIAGIIAQSLPDIISNFARNNLPIEMSTFHAAVLQAVESCFAALLERYGQEASDIKAILEELSHQSQVNPSFDPVMLQKEATDILTLDQNDSPKLRLEIEQVMLQVVDEFCNTVPGMTPQNKERILEKLGNHIETVLMADTNLSTALHDLKNSFEDAKEGESDIGKLVGTLSGLTCSLVSSVVRKVVDEQEDLNVADLIADELKNGVDETLNNLMIPPGQKAPRNAALRELIARAKDGSLQDNHALFSKGRDIYDQTNNVKKQNASNLQKTIVKSGVSQVILNVSKNCTDLPEEMVLNHIDQRVSDLLEQAMDSSEIISAIGQLRKNFEVSGGDISRNDKILNLLSGITISAVPGAIKECILHSQSLEADDFNGVLMEHVEEAVKAILEENGVIPLNEKAEMNELIKIAEEDEFDENSIFFEKVRTTSGNRVNNKSLDIVLMQLTSGCEEGGDVENIILDILDSKPALKEAFEELIDIYPELFDEVIFNILEEDKNSVNLDAIDLIHAAIVRTVQEKCDQQLENLIVQLEKAGKDGKLSNEDIRSMLVQAIGLARLLKRDHVAESLQKVLEDPILLSAIKDDAITRDILRQILLLRKFAERNAKRRNQLQELQKYHSDLRNDLNLMEFVRLSETLTTSARRGKLKKSKSMVKKSKSIITTAKDIPMNAFMAMKNTADSKDERWLQNFLSQSIMEDVPWECSKALIIMKDGYQAIIPREAARNILLGEASYTLIDDQGVEFYLSETDKRKRKGEEIPDEETKRTLKDVLHEDEFYRKASYSDPAKVKAKDSKSTSEKGAKKSSLGYLDDDVNSYRNTNVPYNVPYEDDRSIAESLEKYRPHNFDRKSYSSRAPTESSDINDIRDFYSNVGTRQRALSKYGMADSNDYELDTFKSPRKTSLPTSAYSPFQPEDPSNLRNKRQQSMDLCDPDMDRSRQFPSSKKFWRDEVESARKRSGLPSKAEEEDAEKNRKVYDWENDTFLPPTRPGMANPTNPYDEQQQSVSSYRSPGMSTRTQGLLDKVKESTLALQDLNAKAEEETYGRMKYPFGDNNPITNSNHSHRYTNPYQRQNSREEESRQLNPYARRNRLEDDDSGSRSRYNNHDSEYSRYDPEEVQSPNFQSRYNPYSSQVEDPGYSYSTRGYDRSDSIPATSKSFGREVNPDRMGSAAWRDDEDVDVMIADLKRKTTGRDMRKVLRDLETDPGSHNPSSDYISSTPRYGPDTDYSNSSYSRGGLSYLDPEDTDPTLLRNGNSLNSNDRFRGRSSLDGPDNSTYRSYGGNTFGKSDHRPDAPGSQYLSKFGRPLSSFDEVEERYLETNPSPEKKLISNNSRAKSSKPSRFLNKKSSEDSNTNDYSITNGNSMPKQTLAVKSLDLGNNLDLDLD